MALTPTRDLAWQAPEFEHRPKTVVWYWATIGIAILLLGTAVWQRNWIFAVFIVLAELMMLVWGSHEPRMVPFSLSERGLTIGGSKFYPFTDIRSWSADTQGYFDPEWPEIVLHFNDHFRLSLKIMTPLALLPEIERRFRAHAKEEPFEPSFVDVIEKLLGF